MDLLNMLTGLFTSSSSVDALSAKTGTDSSQTKGIIDTALPLLLGALTNNASSESGASSLMNALMQHTNTASMADQITNADAEDGGKIIGHILGDKASSVVQSISEKTGANTEQVSTLLSNIAPGMLSGISAATTATKKAKVVSQNAVLKDAAEKQAAKATVKVVSKNAALKEAAETQAEKTAAKVVAKANAIDAAKAAVKEKAAKEAAEIEAAAKEAVKEETEEAAAGFDLSGLMGLLGGSEVKSDGLGGLSGLLGGLGGLFGGGSESNESSDDGGGLLGALKNILK